MGGSCSLVAFAGKVFVSVFAGFDVALHGRTFFAGLDGDAQTYLVEAFEVGVQRRAVEGRLGGVQAVVLRLDGQQLDLAGESRQKSR